MLFKAIQVGSQIFQEEADKAGFYDTCLSSLVLDINDNKTIMQNEVRKLHKFINEWGTRCQWSVEQLTEAIISVQADLSALSKYTILDINFKAFVTSREGYYSDMIKNIFEWIATCGPRRETTGTSKVLHMLNPQLFVMWDNKIRGGYACSESAQSYSCSFLPRIQMVLTKAIKEAEKQLGLDHNHAIEKLCQRGHTLAKVVDEYNYVKFTWARPEVWEEEFK